MERFLDNSRQLFHSLNQVVVFGHRTAHSHYIGLLEGIFSDHRLGNLTCDRYNGNRIHLGIHNTGHQVGGSRTRCSQNHAHPTGSLGISFSSENGSLLMAG